MNKSIATYSLNLGTNAPSVGVIADVGAGPPLASSRAIDPLHGDRLIVHVCLVNGLLRDPVLGSVARLFVVVKGRVDAALLTGAHIRPTVPVSVVGLYMDRWMNQ